MTLTLDSVKLNHQAIYLGQKSFNSKVLSEHTHTLRSDCSTWTTKLVGSKL